MVAKGLVCVVFKYGIRPSGLEMPLAANETTNCRVTV